MITLYLRRINPDVIAARVNRHEGTKGWDRVLLSILIPTLVMIVPVAALDDGRFTGPTSPGGNAAWDMSCWLPDWRASHGQSQ